MTDTTTPAPADAEAQALAQARAGYEGRKARTSAAPAAAAAPEPEKTVEPPAAQPSADAAPAPSASAPAEPEDEQEPHASTEPAPSTEAEQLRAQLDDLKLHVRGLQDKGADKETVRRMHGEIGEINRSLKQLLAAKPADAPAAEDKLAAAMARAQKTAEDYPEIAGPFLEAIQELSARMPSKEPPAEPSAQPPAQEPTPEVKPTADDREEIERQAAQAAAIKALNEAHPDRHTIRESPEFKTWFAGWKTPEDRQRVLNSWNPVVVAEPFTAWKAHLEAQKRKKERVEAAVQPQGTAHQPQPTQPTDTELARRGYARYAGKRL